VEDVEGRDVIVGNTAEAAGEENIKGSEGYNDYRR
jgi:hypothetical protein